MLLTKQDKILVAGAHGMVGSALVRCLQAEGFTQLLSPSHHELDYIHQEAVQSYLQLHRPDVVIVAAAKVGGIWANMTYPAEFIYNNLMISCNLIHESHKAGVRRLLYLGSTCIYPRNSPQPIPEEALLTSVLESTNEAYALAKIAGVKLCQYYRQQYGRQYIAAMPTNLYGINDNYHPENSHVIPALIGRFDRAKKLEEPEVLIWGSGKAQREFLYVDDLAEASIHLLKVYDDSLQINVGSPEEVTIRHLAEMIADVVGYRGKILQDLDKPDGAPRKKTNIDRILQLGWAPKVGLEEGLKRSYAHYLSNSLRTSFIGEITS